MSELYERWHELSKRGGLDLAGCQILADWKKEADGLRRELDTANQALNAAMVREGRLRENKRDYPVILKWHEEHVWCIRKVLELENSYAKSKAKEDELKIIIQNAENALDMLGIARHEVAEIYKLSFRIGTAFAEAQGRETELREALEKLREIWWSDKTDTDKEVADYEQMIDIIDKALSTPSPAADRIKALEAVAEAASNIIQAIDSHGSSGMKVGHIGELRYALAALEKAGGS